MNTAERMVGGVNASRVARQALSWATREARLGQAPLLIVRDQPDAADAVGLDDQVQFSDSPNDLDPIEAVHAIEHDIAMRNAHCQVMLVRRLAAADPPAPCTQAPVSL